MCRRGRAHAKAGALSVAGAVAGAVAETVVETETVGVTVWGACLLYVFYFIVGIYM